jgi:hypothetical protein
MRKIAVVAILAIIAAMVPASIASSQPTPGTLDGVGTLMIINAHTTPLDLWIRVDGTFQKIDLTSTDQEEFQLPQGDHAFRVCGDGSTSETCAFATTPGSVHVGSNDIINFLISPNPITGPTWVYAAENDTDKTETDHAKLTFFNVVGIGIAVCVGDNLEIVSPAGSANQNVAEFDSKDGEGQLLKIVVGGGPATDCAAAPTSRELGFPSGSNTVINATINPNCTTDCGYQIFPGEDPPSSSQQVDAFCAVVLEAANITPWLQALVDEIEVGNEDTYPSPDHVEKVINRIAELLEKGNQTAPSDIKPTWLEATAQFVLTGRLAAVQFDLAALSQDDLRTLVDSIEHPGADDPEEAAVTATLTAWVTANCFGTTAIEAEPSFTG